MASKRLQELKSSKGSSRKDKSASTKKSDKTPAKVFRGWDLPSQQDENDIVNWMKREENGDNKRKPRPNEEMPEESFRHDFLRCRNVENQMEFERESLHERYRKNCQVGAKPMEAMSPTHWKKHSGDIDNPLPPRRLRFPRSCKSAELPSTPKISTLQQSGLGCMDSENPTPLTLSRSHSVIDDSRLKAYGLTLPPDEKTLRLLELAEKFTAKRDANTTGAAGKRRRAPPEDCLAEDVADEGYDSKVSSNDNDVDDDTEGSKVAQHDGSSVYTNLDSVLRGDQCAADTSSHNDLDEEEELEGGDVMDTDDRFRNHTAAMAHAHKLLAGTGNGAHAQKDSIAKLIYSRRDLNVYERSPSRRKDTSFRYAGKEQSRLIETSLNNITPGYLNMHQLANFGSVSPNSGLQAHPENQSQVQFLFKHYTQHHPGISSPNHPQYRQHFQHYHHHSQNHNQASNSVHNSYNNNASIHSNNNPTRQLQYVGKQLSSNLLQENNIDQKQLSLRRICLQDANGSGMSNSHTPVDNPISNSPHNNSTPGPPGINNKVHRIKSGASTKHNHGNNSNSPAVDTPDGADDSITQPIQSTTNDQLISKTSNNLLRIQDMSSKISLPHKSRIHGGLQSPRSKNNTPDGESHSHSPGNNPTPSPRNNNNNNNNNNSTNVKVTPPAGQSDTNGSSLMTNPVSAVLMKYYNKNHPSTAKQHTDSPVSEQSSCPSTSRGQGHTTHTQQSERVAAHTFFPVADLLPAVENNLRRRKKRGLGKQPSLMYRSHTMLDSNLWQKDTAANMNGSRGDTQAIAASYHDLSNHPATTGATLWDEMTKAAGLKGDITQTMGQKAFGPPKFRPHIALSPLQRAKEIANRRIHGYLTKYPDGLEPNGVITPQNGSTRQERIHSASRRLGPGLYNILRSP